MIEKLLWRLLRKRRDSEQDLFYSLSFLQAGCFYLVNKDLWQWHGLDWYDMGSGFFLVPRLPWVDGVTVVAVRRGKSFPSFFYSLLVWALAPLLLPPFLLSIIRRFFWSCPFLFKGVLTLKVLCLLIITVSFYHLFLSLSHIVYYTSLEIQSLRCPISIHFVCVCACLSSSK